MQMAGSEDVQRQGTRAVLQTVAGEVTEIVDESVE